ncbi:MAG: GTP 3',8-cyclase MoaA [Candidatus Thermoplasmatota archaeon]|jgi:cyclic pyranopterin phosphate synthase|nr:GTP 3',8-cyclase MoaA [Candidatus Thermoplasmatota archaeon]
MLYDYFGRPLNSLRIQVNATCNFKCFFCHMEGTDENAATLTPEEIERVVAVAAENGVNRIKFTGGEPLLRKDLEEIIGRTRKHVDGDISLTTNAYFLKQRVKGLRDAGLNRINISMHSIEQDKFVDITKVDAIDVVEEGIDAAIGVGLSPVKVNFVVLKGINDDQIDAMIDFTAKKGAILQLIEYETDREGEMGQNYRKYHYDLRIIEKKLMPTTESVEYNALHNRKRVKVLTQSGRHGTVEFVRPQRNADFCNHCTRLRVTSKGEFQTCLNRKDQLFSFKGKDNVGIFDSFRNAVAARVPYWREADESSY